MNQAIHKERRMEFTFTREELTEFFWAMLSVVQSAERQPEREEMGEVVMALDPLIERALDRLAAATVTNNVPMREALRGIWHCPFNLESPVDLFSACAQTWLCTRNKNLIVRRADNAEEASALGSALTLIN